LEIVVVKELKKILLQKDCLCQLMVQTMLGL